MDHSSRSLPLASCALALVLVLAGCAKVSVRKIDANGNASGPDGIRYYMPRPYVAVNEPFVIAANAYLVNGQLTPDRQYVLINRVDGDLDGHFKAHGGQRASIDATTVRALTTTPSGPSPVRGGEQAETGAPTEPPRAPVSKDSGQLDLKVANDNNAFAVTPLRRYFDIVWLPDFDEQYVVSGKAGFGNADVSIATGQGWSLQGLEAHVDNSAITERILALYDESIKILTQLGRTALLGPGGLVMGGGEQADTSVAEAFEGGTPLTLKVTVVRVVAPGLYPILKPDELRQLGDYASIRAIDEEFGDRILVPVPPLTNIAFNTYEVLVVEAARADGDSAMRLHQYVFGKDASVAPGLSADGTADPLTEATQAANADLEGLARPGEPHWVVTMKYKDASRTSVQAVVKSSGGTKPSLGRAGVIDALKAALSGHNLSVEDADVTIEDPGTS